MFWFQHAPRYEDIAGFLSAAAEDNNVAVIKEPVIEHPGGFLRCFLDRQILNI